MSMQRPLRVVVYGFLIWWLWFAFVGAAQLLPEAVRAAPSFALLRLLVLVLLAVALAVDYLRRVSRSSAGEGLVVGVVWMALQIANDLGHFRLMEPTFDPVAYLMTAAPLYAFIPAMTVTMFGQLVAAAPIPSTRASDEGAKA